MVWEIWNTLNLKIFENINRRVEEIWATLIAHIKETITLIAWSIEDLEDDGTEKKNPSRLGNKSITSEQLLSQQVGPAIEQCRVLAETFAQCFQTEF